MVFEEVTMMAGFIAGLIVMAMISRIAGAVSRVAGAVDAHIAEHRAEREFSRKYKGSDDEDIGA